MIRSKFRSKLVATALFGLPLSIFAQQKIIAPIDYQYLSVAPQEKVLTAKNQAVMNDIFGALFQKDWGKIRSLYADNYIQHNPDMKDGKEGVIELFSAMDFEKAVYKPQMQIAEGPYVVLFGKFQFTTGAPEMAVLDINYVQDGQSREHWDMLEMSSFSNKNASGHTHFDSKFTDKVKVDEKQLAKNKQIVMDFLNQFFNQKNFDNATKKYVDANYTEHDANGKDGSKSLLMASQSGAFNDYEYNISKVIGENDLILTHSRVHKGSKRFAVVDICRVRGNKIVEHWSVKQEIPEPAKFQHRNGMF